MKRLMMGGASTYESQKGNPTAIEYWVQAYLGSCLWMDEGAKSKNKETRDPSNSKKIYPAPPPLQNVFAEWMENPESWDQRELFLLCKAFNVNLPANYLSSIIAHPKQRNHISDNLMLAAHNLLTNISRHIPEARIFSAALSEKEWKMLTPLDRKVACRFQWLTGKNAHWIEWISTLPAAEQVEILHAGLYYPPGPIPDLIDQLKHSKSKKVRALLLILSWRIPQNIDISSLPDWIVASKDVKLGQLLETEMQWPQPPLIATPLPPKKRVLAWLPPDQLKKLEVDQILRIHSAYYHRQIDDIKIIWESLSPTSEALPLYRAAGRTLNPGFFEDQVKQSLDKSSFPPEQIDIVHKFIYMSDLFISKKQSPQIWDLMQDWSEMSELSEPSSNLSKMTLHLSNRLHPSVPIEETNDPFDFFDAPIITKWEENLKKRRSLYQKMATWQKNN